MQRSEILELMVPLTFFGMRAAYEIETPLFGKLGLGEADAQQLAQTLLQQIPARHFGKPEEVATAVDFSPPTTRPTSRESR